MQTPTAEEYVFLAELARAYSDTHLRSIKQQEGWNPRLGIDALCFQRHGDERMVGALITPCELWLVMVPDQSRLTAPLSDRFILTLPSGSYNLTLERLPGGYEIYKRAILHNLSDLDSMQEAARLAQQMMSRLMQKPEQPNR